MAHNVWSFGPAKRHQQVYKNGDEVPHLKVKLKLNGVEVGYVEIHTHKRYGRDRKADVSFGFTGVVYGPTPGGK